MLTGTVEKCPNCKGGFAKEHEEQRSNTIHGLIILDKVRFMRCTGCGEDYFNAEQARAVRTKLAKEL